MARKYSTKWWSAKQEKRVAKEISGKQVVASGSKWGSKGDVRTTDFLVECKTTKKNFYTLNIKTWEKIEREATKDGLRIPIMCIDLEGGKVRLALFNSGTFDINTSGDYIGNYRVCKSVRIDKSFVGRSIRFTTKPDFNLQVCEWEDVVYEICRGSADYVT